MRKTCIRGRENAIKERGKYSEREREREEREESESESERAEREKCYQTHENTRNTYFAVRSSSVIAVWMAVSSASLSASFSQSNRKVCHSPPFTIGAWRRSPHWSELDFPSKLTLAPWKNRIPSYLGWEEEERREKGEEEEEEERRRKKGANTGSKVRKQKTQTEEYESTTSRAYSKAAV
jgi:hypothetical protein